MRYFVDDARRLVRTDDDEVLPLGFFELLGWRQVSSEEYDDFRKETATLFNTPAKKKQLKQLRARSQ